MTRRNFSFTDDRKRRAEEIRSHYPTARSVLLPMLWLVHDQEGWIPDGAVDYLGAELGMSPAEVREVVSFYSMFRTSPGALHEIRFCTGICCKLRDSERMRDYVRKRLGIGMDEVSEDGRFLMIASDCLGLCDKAPAMMIGDERYEDLTEERVDGILRKLGAKF